MSYVYLDSGILVDIADAIRAKTGGSNLITPANMATEIASITSGPPPLVAWDLATDNQIDAMIKSYYAGTITLSQIQEYWSVGQTRTFTIGAMSATGVEESHRQQTVELTIIDFTHDNLTTATNGITKALVTVQLKNCLRDANVTDTNANSNTEAGKMYPTNENNWKTCGRRTWCNEVFYNALPSYLKDNVKAVNKVCCIGATSNSSTEIVSDLVWFPSEWEMFGKKEYAPNQEGTAYSYYYTSYTYNENRNKLPKTTSNDRTGMYWFRSPYAGSSGFCHMKRSDAPDASSSSTATRGIAPAFCL